MINMVLSWHLHSSLFWLIKNVQTHGAHSDALGMTCVAWLPMVFAMDQVPTHITSIPMNRYPELAPSAYTRSHVTEIEISNMV